MDYLLAILESFILIPITNAFLEQFIAFAALVVAFVGLIFAIFFNMRNIYFTRKQDKREEKKEQTPSEAPDIRVSFFNMSEVKDVYYFLPFKKDTVYVVPFRVEISNAGSDLAKNVTINVEFPEKIYQKSTGRNYSEMFDFRDMKATEYEGKSKYQIGHAINLGNINRKIKGRVVHQIYANKPTMFKKKIRSKTHVGVPVEANFSVDLCYIVKVTVQGENFDAIVKECNIHYRVGREENIKLAIKRENKRRCSLNKRHLYKEIDALAEQMTILDKEDCPLKRLVVVSCSEMIDRGVNERAIKFFECADDQVRIRPAVESKFVMHLFEDLSLEDCDLAQMDLA